MSNVSESANVSVGITNDKGDVDAKVGKYNEYYKIGEKFVVI
jgi:hypothetical protein